MIDLRLGLKIYDNDWFLKYGMAPEQAADVVAGMGATFVIAQSRFLPMQDSGEPGARGQGVISEPG